MLVKQVFVALQAYSCKPVQSTALLGGSLHSGEAGSGAPVFHWLSADVCSVRITRSRKKVLASHLSQPSALLQMMLELKLRVH